MEETIQTQAVVEVTPAGNHDASPGFMKVSIPLMALTWISFAIVAVLLYKVAWKPILTALDMRERGIRKAVEDAERARREAIASEERNRKLLQDAELEAQRIVAEARAAAEAGVQQLREETERRAKAMVEEARRDVSSAVNLARESLRRETSEMAVQLASRILAGNMDAEKNNLLIQQALRDIPKA